jgi:two-component system NtrC family sensor kinase
MAAERVSRKNSSYLPFDQDHYRELRRRHLIRLFSTYLAPVVIFILYFSFQNERLITESQRLHLTATAENQANTLNLFLRERVTNLNNLVNSPELSKQPDSSLIEEFLEGLIRINPTFVDLGFFDKMGVQTAYAGPHPELERRDYSQEKWFLTLSSGTEDFIITDIYLGFRQRPHFTIAVKRELESTGYILRATLDPEKMYDYLRSLEGSAGVQVSIVNQDGYYQLVTPHIGTLLESSSIVPPDAPALGSEEIRLEGHSFIYAYSWLRMANWALIVQPAASDTSWISRPNRQLLLISALLLGVLVLMVFSRAGKLVELQMEADQTQAQLEHASKLASVGELAAGIAHEINNPLAVINEEAGLMKDLLNSEFGEPSPPEELVPHLETIEESVIRCKRITHKLLGFVRKSDVDLVKLDVWKVIDEVVDGLLGRGFAVSNIEIIKRKGPEASFIVSDANQLQQVLLNILNNAVDALEGNPGTIVIATETHNDLVSIAITDSGKGMTQEQLTKIFLPFYTTKEVGKGTGLGLSVSYGIMKDLGGRIDVDSTPGVGSTFTLFLPAFHK